jgi:molybdenum cofactor cytidylyltransferase
MGSPKALLPLAGVPMIARVIETISSLPEIQPIVVVTGHAADDVSLALADFNLHLVHNPDYAQGEMLSSVKLGAAALESHCDAFFLILGDQPLIRSQTYQCLLDAYFNVGCSMLNVRCSFPETDEHRTSNTQHPTSNPQILNPEPQTLNPLLQPTYNTHRGHPLLLPATAIKEILSLPPDATLKTYTQRTPTLEIPVDDPAILTDIDTPEDFDRVAKLFSLQSDCVALKHGFAK